MQRHQEGEKARAVAEGQKREREERKAMLEHAFASEIVPAVEAVITAFNGQSEFGKLDIIDRARDG